MYEYWFDRRSGMWWTFDNNPKISYYKFLRAVYGMQASEAWKAAQTMFTCILMMMEAADND